VDGVAAGRGVHTCEGSGSTLSTFSARARTGMSDKSLAEQEPAVRVARDSGFAKCE
jgi:hypothetical protein